MPQIGNASCLEFMQCDGPEHWWNYAFRKRSKFCKLAIPDVDLNTYMANLVPH